MTVTDPVTRTHLLTGAGSGIGAAVADLLHARGDRLVLVARSEQRAAHVAERYDGALTVVADLEDPASLSALGGRLPSEIDSVVHSAGVADLAPVGELEVATFQRTLAVNLVAAVELTRLALPAVRAAQGTVVLVNSGAGLRANPDWGAYAASKFGLRAVADALREEERSHGVRVTSVYPGRTATPMQEHVHAQEGASYEPDRWTSPQTVAEAIVWCLDLPRDASVPDLSIRPHSGGV